MPVALPFRALISAAAVAVAISAVIPAAQAGERLVATPRGASVQPGTIVISARERALYFVIDSARAIRYPVAVPRGSQAWSGTASINGKFQNPDWMPPSIVKRDNPSLPNLIKGGSPSNPMGVAALTLDRSEIAIHGTTSKMRRSIGTAASYGCIRMLNEDVSDLFSRVSVGTPVVMIN